MRVIFKTLSTVLLLVTTTMLTDAQAQQVIKAAKQDTVVVERVYSTGGFATIIIDRPIAAAAAIVTDVKAWPKINVGITKATHLEGDTLKKGAIFHETIASPIPGINDWTNTWLVEEYIPGQKFVMTGAENFAQAPIYTRLTYTFTELSATSTRYSRKIEVSLDAQFLKEARPQEIEALYRFLGSQYEMARHLKKYVEENSL